MNPTRILLGALALVAISCARESPTASSERVVEAGSSFGFCIGPCRSELRLDGEIVALRVTDRTGSDVIAQNRGRLTSRGAARLAGLTASLPDDLLEQYGCPDCADGGASWVTIARDSVTRRTEYDYGKPPSELAAMDEFLAAVMQALRECRESSDVTLEAGCTPT